MAFKTESYPFFTMLDDVDEYRRPLAYALRPLLCFRRQKLELGSWTLNSACALRGRKPYGRQLSVRGDANILEIQTYEKLKEMA